MKLAIINSEKGFRGGERQSLYLARALKKRGLDVSLFLLKDSKLFLRSLEMELDVKSFKNLLSMFFYLVFHGGEYDFLIPFTARAQNVAIFSKMFHRKKVIYTRRVNFKPSKLSLFLKYRFTDVVVAISEAIKDTLEDSGVKNVVVIPSFVIPRKLNVDRALSFKRDFKGKKILGVIASFTEEKNPFLLLEIANELKKKRNDFVFFHFGDGNLRVEFERRLKGLKLEKHYKVFGHVEDVEDFFAIFDIFLMVSKSEGLGSSVLDALLYGVPVISSNVGGLKELVKGNGILCDLHNLSCFVDGISILLDDKNLRLKFIEKGKKVVEEKFSEDVVVKKFVELLKRESG